MFEGFMQPLRKDIPARLTTAAEPALVTAFVVLVFLGSILAAIWF
jgi:hypothetical protein